jgi:hypothetical protein
MRAVRLSWSNWLLRRACELIVFLSVSLIMGLFLDRYALLSSSLLLVTAQVFVYSSVFLYLPLSAAVWLIAHACHMTSTSVRISDSIFFILHSYVTMSLMHDGLLGIARPLDVLTTSTGPWLAVVAWNVALSVLLLFRAKSPP